jgi:uncharacterized membrane protein YccC
MVEFIIGLVVGLVVAAIVIKTFPKIVGIATVAVTDVETEAKKL